jgi:type I restriction enzyme S subunit
LKELDPCFAKFFFRSFSFRREVVKLAQGSTRYNISKIEFMKMKFLFPIFPEQQKIAGFLTSIDKIIESKQQQITQAEQWKKGLMQGLFV